ncbi:bifunctional methylenetetrahydrofolate dehydrogenase/methenyltetrahydrofolate cyclohydrolase FolD [Erysipelotrichaceae bacterium AF19-24AC]|nr:bifunctional methylenetetrahydrofolate dehydrogenase/methenyltetrahydrofolate cyclohydrolase FolD [Erysipelotrichaceae bacterium AF19-24AC]
MGTVLYGSEVAKEIRASLKEQINEIRTAGKRIPKLVVILVGNNTASLSYVSGKEKACREIGMENILLHLKEETTEGELLEEIQRLNEDVSVDGILVQLPLPKHMDEHKILFAIDPKKDVDGFHPYNIGKMMLQEDTYLPCTPKGIMRLLEISGYSDLSGLRAVVIGRSNIVGKPVAQLLLNRNATVTICHSRTKNIEQICASADILIASVGQVRLVKADWVKEGAAVIDVGINRVDGKLCGDVDFEDVKDKTAVITPVPKGVGPMTIAMLLENTLEAYRKNYHAD